MNATANKLDVLEASLEWFNEALKEAVGVLVVDRGVRDPEALAALLNSDFWYGALRGVSSPRISREGLVLEEKRRPYSVDEVALLLTLPSVQTYIEGLQAERAIETKEELRTARIEQLASARLAKAIKRERELTPILSAEVGKLQAMVLWLTDQLTRASVGAGTPPTIQFVVLEKG